MPPCSKCPEPAVAFLRYAGTHLCRSHFLHSFERRAKAEVARQGRLPEGRLAVALSGGKDSVAALHFLRKLTRDHPRVELVAVTVDEGIAGYRPSALAICRQVTERLGVPWHVVRTRDLAGYTIDQYAAGAAGPAGEAPGSPRPACGPCGVFRRLGMNRLARDLGAVALVTGHNLDDQAQTVLMNHLKGDLDRLARLAPHATAEANRHGGLVPRLLPFRTIPEKEVLLYALLEGLPLHDEAECPYAARSHRFALRDVLVGLEAQSPGTRHALVKGHERLKPILQAALPAVAVASCPACGEPTSATDCIACTLRA
ncbi:MAG TPA: TIGR00269 family protein [Candidatus Thermoplasmatota archaeon]|nr:TIGR00269 family protein [Candidatus Thermoplasmatota archaeon]